MGALREMQHEKYGARQVALLPISTARGNDYAPRSMRAPCAYTSSHSLRTLAFARKSAGEPENTIEPWPIT